MDYLEKKKQTKNFVNFPMYIFLIFLLKANEIYINPCIYITIIIDTAYLHPSEDDVTANLNINSMKKVPSA